MYTGLNEKYVRSWYEINYQEIAFGFTRTQSLNSNKKWYPYANGGPACKWFGDNTDVVLWQHDGKQLTLED